MDRMADLYGRFVGGDRACFEEIVAGYYDGLVLYIYGYLGNYHDAEDIVQETFSYLAIKKPHFRGESSFKTWLYRMAVNRSTSHMRSEGRAAFTELTDSVAASGECDPEALLIREQRNAKLYEAMRALKKEYYLAIYLRYFEDLSTREIARVMKKTEKQVSNCLSRGREALRKKLGEDEYENV